MVARAWFGNAAVPMLLDELLDGSIRRAPSIAGVFSRQLSSSPRAGDRVDLFANLIDGVDWQTRALGDRRSWKALEHQAGNLGVTHGERREVERIAG